METPADGPPAAIPMDSFRVRLMLARLHAGDLTIKEAAGKCGLNYGSWSNWERGMKPRDLLDVTQRIADGLGVDLHWLRDGGPLTPEARQNRITYGSSAGHIRMRSHALLADRRHGTRPPETRPPGHPRQPSPYAELPAITRPRRPSWACEGAE